MEFNRFAISSYPRFIIYTLRSIEVPCAASIAINITIEGLSAGGHTTCADFRVVVPVIYTRCGSAKVIFAPSLFNSVA